MRQIKQFKYVEALPVDKVNPFLHHLTRALVGMINSDNIITVYEFLGLENIAGQLAKVSDNELVVHYLILQSIYDPPQFKEACAKLKQVVPERKENAGDLAQARKMEAVMEIIFPLIKLQEDSVYFVEEFGNALRLPQDLVNSYKTKAQSKKPNPFQKLRNKFSSDDTKRKERLAYLMKIYLPEKFRPQSDHAIDQQAHPQEIKEQVMSITRDV